ncbi:MAG: hypothetical protein Q9218_003747 [Villophora microphyllina]
MPHNTAVESTSAQEIFRNRPTLPPKPFTDPRRLAPEDAVFANPSLRPQGDPKAYLRPSTGVNDVNHSVAPARRRREKDRGRSGSRRGKAEWKKLLWVKQPKYPDNYTDPPTFLSHLQRNPRLQPYDFWPLVADSTVIVQHLSSVAIFICCFVGIYEEKVSPTYVSALGNVCTVLGWGFWDYWVGQAQASRVAPKPPATSSSGQHTDQQQSRPSSRESEPPGLGLTLGPGYLTAPSNRSHSNSVAATLSSSTDPSPTVSASNGQFFPTQNTTPGFQPTNSSLSPRNQQRLATVKSAVLIYCALLGLSPILKSLTMSTSKDSIWAISASLMCLNIFFFDYGGGVGVK